ncbi:NAD(P)/FAD-dependent oxidoreductase [Litoreibacter roseus]|uniref:FAD-binding domain-containing protein n=1 Tax=Litoreibacter roseus TaxID=2601869 RepID=A0A6N6JF36_9RHOB|nr:NAD(P)/FAD-dependent oxidoreductase [Litoreibacter roseus]GFE64973.1 hypothetical protein KIN_20470 [Litoreibacter roseus]
MCPWGGRITASETYDVLIVGGGPAGLAVAQSLAPGTRALLVHQDREIGKPVRTSGGSWLADVTALGIPETLYHIVGRVDLYTDGRHLPVGLDSDPVVILDVTALYQWLATSAQAEIRTGTKFLSAEVQGDAYRVLLRGPDKREVTVTARYVIDASGWHMAVLENLGLNQKPHRRGVGIEYEFQTTAFDRTRAVLFFGSTIPGGYGWAFPTREGAVRLGVGVLEPDNPTSPRVMMEKLLASDALVRMGIPQPANHHVNAGIIPSVPFERDLIHGQVIRVGDSAHMATPTLGEGIRICIEQGRALGAALSRTLDTGNDRPLKTWESSVQRRLALQYRVGLWANKTAAGYSPQQWDRGMDRLAKLSDAELIAFMRNEFSAPMIMRRAAKMVASKAVRLMSG